MSLTLRDRLNLLTVDLLKIEIKKFKAKLGGVKEDLVERLAFLIEREQDASIRDPAQGNTFTSNIIHATCYTSA